MKFKKTRKFFSAVFAGFLATTDSPGTPEGKKLPTDRELLETANDLFSQISGLTGNNPKIDPTFRESIHEIAQTGCRETQ